MYLSKRVNSAQGGTYEALFVGPLLLLALLVLPGRPRGPEAADGFGRNGTAMKSRTRRSRISMAPISSLYAAGRASSAFRVRKRINETDVHHLTYAGNMQKLGRTVRIQGYAEPWVGGL